MKMRNIALHSAFFALVAFTAASCSKNQAAGGQARLQVSLTDAPGDFEAVFIDVQDIKINATTDSAGGWQSLGGVRRGTYNLLDLVNGKDTLLSDALLPAGRIQQIRLILGDGNYVKVAGKLLKLTTPSAQQSGLKLNIQQELSEGGTYQLLLDFDVAKSVHEAASGKYILRPTIRAVLHAVTGIKGVVAPDSVRTAVIALQGADTVASTYTMGGQYRLRGLNAGVYDLHFLPTDTSFSKQVKTGITVTTATMALVDTVHLN